jgi:hypothetical protein
MEFYLNKFGAYNIKEKIWDMPTINLISTITEIKNILVDTSLSEDIKFNIEVPLTHLTGNTAFTWCSLFTKRKLKIDSRYEIF